ncbi:hypothetical protein P7C71_g1934, partial [Lecanoromycetidae sp. Uapishka_2]
MPSSPQTPARRRKSSAVSIDISFTSPSPQSNGYRSKRPSISSRRSSQYSIASPMTPRPVSSHDRNTDIGYSNDYGEAESANGLGNLADELAGLDEDEEGEAAEVFSQDQYDGAKDQWHDVILHQQSSFQTPLRENNGVSIPQKSQPTRELSLSPPKQKMRSRQHHRENSVYDGSDYGDDSDLEGIDGISPALDARMAAVESLARRGTEANGSDRDSVVHRVADALKDLGSQAGVENAASRLITAHTALTSHLSSQTRTLQTLCYPYLSPFAAHPDLDFVEEIMPLLSELLLTLPKPTTHPLSSIHNLHASTTELTSILTYLSDTLHMTRQTTSLAARRLRTARETVIEIRKEAEAREEGERWIEKGDWDTRLASRDCARICGDVVGGFEEVCNGWRERLLSGSGVVGLAAA